MVIAGFLVGAAVIWLALEYIFQCRQCILPLVLQALRDRKRVAGLYVVCVLLEQLRSDGCRFHGLIATEEILRFVEL